MESFARHADEATLFILLGAWWTFNAFPEYIKAVWQDDDFYSKCSYPWPGFPKLPIEALVKLAFPLFGMGAEAISSGLSFTDENDRLTHLNSIHRMSIYGIFAAHAVIDVLARLGAPLPRAMDRVTAALAFGWYALSTTVHVQMWEQDELAAVSRTMSTYAIYLVAACYLLEAVRPSWFLVHLSRIFGVLLLGSWLWHVAFILYKPTPFPGNLPNQAWDRDDKRNVHFIMVLFGFHLSLHLVLISLLYMMTVCILRARGQHKSPYHQMSTMLDETAIL